MKKAYDDKIWAILVHLTNDQWVNDDNNKPMWEVFDDEMWDYIVEQSAKCELNTIVLDCGNGIEYASHPEIVKEGAWTRKKVRDEIKRCKALGISLIPKLNFATPHDMWLGKYARMVSTEEYYKVANDLIKEVYELFDHPEYIHLGMDEEDAKHVAKHEFALYRQGELYWHDLRFLIDCVADTGAKPWIWTCPLFDFTEEYIKRIGVDEVVLSPWYYNAFRKEHWTPISSREVYVTYYNEGQYKDMGLEFVEEDPFLVNVRAKAVPLAKEHGYKYIPCASVCNRCDYNTSDLLEYFKENLPDEQILGYITAPWCMTNKSEKCMIHFEESFRFLKEARDKFYR